MRFFSTVLSKAFAALLVVAASAALYVVVSLTATLLTAMWLVSPGATSFAAIIAAIIVVR